ncbi:MAG: hypothetical protein KAT20_03935, partial [Desulfuromonadales bacterium]|nr:hypothetical protein [Desulfuromonadales bacterium]
GTLSPSPLTGEGWGEGEYRSDNSTGKSHRRGDPCDRPCSVGDQGSGEYKIRPYMCICIGQLFGVFLGGR